MISENEVIRLDPTTYGMPNPRKDGFNIPVFEAKTGKYLGFFYETAGGFVHAYRAETKKDRGSFRSNGSADAWIRGE